MNNLEKELEEINDDYDEIQKYFENKADADFNHATCLYHINQEMRLLQRIIVLRTKTLDRWNELIAQHDLMNKKAVT